MDFLKYSKIYYIFSGSLIFLSIIFLILWGFELGSDFIGGALLEVEFQEKRPNIEDLRKKITIEIKTELTLQEIGERGVILRAKDISSENHQKIIEIFNKEGKIIEKKFEMIGPVIGRELKKSTLISLILGIFFITIYIIFAFRKVSRFVPSSHYGLITLVTLFHDILITCGFFAFLGKFLNLEVNIPFAAALLTIIGYSVNDTIVIFDRCRENLMKIRGELKEILNKSLNETYTRSFLTSFSLFVVLVALYFFGGETISSFVLALMIGTFFGTYSSIFIAASLLNELHRK